MKNKYLYFIDMICLFIYASEVYVLFFTQKTKITIMFVAINTILVFFAPIWIGYRLSMQPQSKIIYAFSDFLSRRGDGTINYDLGRRRAAIIGIVIGISVLYLLHRTGVITGGQRRS